MTINDIIAEQGFLAVAPNKVDRKPNIYYSANSFQIEVPREDFKISKTVTVEKFGTVEKIVVDLESDTICKTKNIVNVSWIEDLMIKNLELNEQIIEHESCINYVYSDPRNNTPIATKFVMK